MGLVLWMVYHTSWKQIAVLGTSLLHMIYALTVHYVLYAISGFHCAVARYCRYEFNIITKFMLFRSNYL